jgi:CDP-diacylglycerol--glycerol-3-phosphate 3-phosphatidyltransferase
MWEQTANIVLAVWNDNKKMTISNGLTVLRMMVLAPFVLYFLLEREPIIAAIIFIIAAFTDQLDGFLARRWKQVSATGELLDPIADKILVLVPLVVLIEYGINQWLVLLIFLRELGVTLGRFFLNGREEVKPAISVNFLGKVKATAQYVCIAYAMLGLPYPNAVMSIAVILTLWSGVNYSLRAVKVLKRVECNK